MIAQVFVYGTLKRGQERERNWPRPPRRIEPAEIRGELYDLGPYPALLHGDDRVLGELWFLEPADLEATLRTLDEIECFGVEDVDLYVRETVECRTLADGLIHSAHVYFLADPGHARIHRRVRPGADGFVEWRA
jgi:gamma-glutamylcyclotransferase (GGCT)/AIG2-like uncharacterized protein YtfP